MPLPESAVIVQSNRRFGRRQSIFFGNAWGVPSPRRFPRNSAWQNAMPEHIFFTACARYKACRRSANRAVRRDKA